MPPLDPKTLNAVIAIGLLLGALLVGFSILQHLRRRMVEGSESDPDRNLLSQFQAAYDAGELDESGKIVLLLTFAGPLRVLESARIFAPTTS